MNTIHQWPCPMDTSMGNRLYKLSCVDFVIFGMFLQALVAMAAENGGQVMCPRTKETFKIADIKKVYVM